MRCKFYKMAAPCRSFAKYPAISLHQMWLKPWIQGSCVRVPRFLPHLRTVSWRSGPQFTSVRPEPQNDSNTDEGPEYIPRKKAKNPMTKVGYAWMIGLPSGILAFILAKREVEKNRQKQLRIRQRMKKSNEGEYDSERYGVSPKTH